MLKKDDESKLKEQNESLSDSKKIDLYINNNDNEDQGISILNVFSRLKQRFHIYVFVMIIGLIAGLLVPTVMYTFKDKSESAVAIVGLDYENAEEGVAPDGSELDISYLKSSYIIQNALSEVTLSKKVSTAQIQSNLVITGILSDETKQKMEIIEKLEEVKNVEYANMLKEFVKKYRAQYIISLNNTFVSGSSKTVLPTDELSNLLGAITKAYNDYFVVTYQEEALPANQLKAMNVNFLDYLEILDITRDFLSALSEYCANRTSLVPGFRTSDGLSFSDLSGAIETLNNANISDIYSYIFLNNVCKNAYMLLNNYQEKKQAVINQLSVVESNIASVKQAMDDYEKDVIEVRTPGSDQVGRYEITSEYYNQLVLQYSDLQSQKTELEKEKEILEYRIDKLNGSPATDAQKAEVETKVNEVLSKAQSIYELVSKNSKELYKSNAYQNRYMHSITTTEREGIRDNLKMFGIGAAAGLGLGLLLWIADAFILEFRHVKKVNDLKEAE